MINYLISLFQNPENGFDPVPKAHANRYFEEAYSGQRFNNDVISHLENFISLKNKKIIDLGGGPGQYTHYFVEQGAEVYYHDISTNYLSLFRQKFPDLNYNASIGYIDNFSGKYDIIFNSVCFNYCMNDKQFVKKIEKSLLPGGLYFGVLGNENTLKRVKKKRLIVFFQFYLNAYLGIKIGHPFTLKKNIKKLFNNKIFNVLKIEDIGKNTLVVVKKKVK